jgi:ribosomal protein S18 acetylase RimI-like enzyme
MTFEIHPVTPERWPHLVELFERRGPRGGHRNTPAYGCWCMYWRDRTLAHGEPKKRALAKLVRAGREPGLLAYDGDVPIGWVSVAPREEYSAILRSPQYRPRDGSGGPAVWSIVCFVVDRYAQRRGIASALLEAAVEHAFAHGASSVEAYPHAADPRDYMGHTGLYRSSGFVHVRDANKRTIVRRERPG